MESKIRWTLQSNTQRPYAEPKLLCVHPSPLLLHIAHMAGMLDGASAVLIICPMAIWQKTNKHTHKKKKTRTSLGAALAHKELRLSDCSEALCS